MRYGRIAMFILGVFLALKCVGLTIVSYYYGYWLLVITQPIFCIFYLCLLAKMLIWRKINGGF
jgi:hypothetical protein